MLSALLSGGLTGVIGSLVSNITDIWKRRQDRQHELKLRQLDIQMMDKEWEYRERQAETEASVDMQESADSLRADSYDHDARTYSVGLEVEAAWSKALLVLADFIRALVRPALTVFLIWLVWETRMEVVEVLDAAGMQGISAEQAVSVYASVVDMILYLASTAVTWWFGTRPISSKKQV